MANQTNENYSASIDQPNAPISNEDVAVETTLQ